MCLLWCCKALRGNAEHVWSAVHAKISEQSAATVCSCYVPLRVRAEFLEMNVEAVASVLRTIGIAQRYLRMPSAHLRECF